MNSKNNLSIALLISGGGSTMEAVIKACQSGELKANPALIISSRKNAGGIEKAHALGIKGKNILYIQKDFPTPQAFGENILIACRERKIDVIGQCGWLPVTPDNVIEEYDDRIFNQHPGALDPGHKDFGGKGMYGLRVPATSVYFKKGLIANNIGRRFYTEATTHLVTSSIDKGTILRQREIEVEENYTPEVLQKLLLPFEHSNVINTIADYTNGKPNYFYRIARLIQRNEIEILEKSKEKAIKNYP